MQQAEDALQEAFLAAAFLGVPARRSERGADPLSLCVLIPDLTAFPDFDATEPFPATPGQLVQRLLAKPLDFPPGADFSCSNSGYILLGYLLEKITGQTCPQFIQQNIFDCLGMKDSGYDSNAEIIARHAAGYTPGKHGLAVAGYVDMTIPFAAGGLYSTTEMCCAGRTGSMAGSC